MQPDSAILLENPLLEIKQNTNKNFLLQKYLQSQKKKKSENPNVY